MSLAAAQDNSVTFEDPFHVLKVTGNIHLELIPSNYQKLIGLSEDQPEVLEMENSSGRLELKTKSELNKDPSINLVLHYMQLSEIEITKGGRVQSADTLKTNILKLDVVTGGKVELLLRVDSLSARVNQGADIILYGNTRSQYINAYTWGNFLGYELISNHSFVKAATGAQVKVNANVLLEANATSKAFIGYSGNPGQKRFKTSVGGEITPWTE